MFVSLNWLRKYVDTGSLSPEQLGEKITKSGIEVEGIHYIAEKSEGVVVGHVLSREPHPNADKLSVCQVDIGEETLQIVCGAPNVEAGQYVAVAKPGATLPGNFHIKQVSIRDIESNGMICSLQELGIDEQYIPTDIAEGIFVFREDVNVGDPVEPLLNLNDAIFEFDLTPNRSDCLSMIGVAYEVAAILDAQIQLPDETVETIDEHSKQYVSVKVDDSKLAPYYGAFIITDIEIKQSPLWMQNFLIASGIRPINNVVDITNYVLLEYGQPLHAFDYDRLGSKEIVVRTANDGEKMITLDGKERTLSSEHLLITSGDEPIALAGVMGGANSEVHEETKTILLESAYFDPQTVRNAAQFTGLRSDASNRFEKGVDPNRVDLAAIRACQLLQKYASGKVLKKGVIFDELNRTEKTVDMNIHKVNKRLGTNISPEEIDHILNKLRFPFTKKDDNYVVTIPTRRGDIAIFEDMLEEVARIYGYDFLPYTLPANASRPGALTTRQRVIREVNQYLQGVGLSEAITYSLTKESYAQRLISPEYEGEQLENIKLAMPLSEEHQFLRLSLLPQLLQSVAYNKARSEPNIAYYEFGSIFVTDDKKLSNQPEEKLRLSGVLTGKWVDHQWQQENKFVDFYVVKGLVEGLFHFLKLPISFTQVKLTDMHPGRCATVSIQEEVVGFIGQVHPLLASEMDLNETYVFDLNIEKILDKIDHTPSYKTIPRYPSVTRDIAFIVDQNIHASHVQETIQNIGAPLVTKVTVFDVYEGENLAENKKSIAYRLHYLDPTKTLKDKEVEKSYRQIIELISEKFAAYVRE